MSKILTLHPETGKVGVNIDKDKYDQVRKVILEQLDSNTTHTFKSLLEVTCRELDNQGFDGRPGWYMTTVKLDLEARGLLVHDRKTKEIKLL